MNRFLSMLQFSEADLQRKIGTLSGGHHARVAIAQCLLSGAACRRPRNGGGSGCRGLGLPISLSD
ncbi:hypothetical protein GCM10022282_26510 [Agromyces indicus]|uniref:hypothetical protein n=1 Tax=Agromyces indicus TaxID=758919 RepID=UPI0031DFD8D8